MGATVALFLFDQESDENSIIPRVVNRGLVDGVIVTATQMGDPLVDHLQRVDMPFVIIGRPDDGRSMFSVDADNRGGARLAARHLVGLGRTKVGLISPPSNSTAGLDRRNGFLEGLAESGVDLNDRIAEGNWTDESGRQAMEHLLDSGEPPDAVFVGSDRMAVGALRAIRDRGLTCPDDVAVVSFDGILSPDQTVPRLTSVAQPVAEVGERSCPPARVRGRRHGDHARAHRLSNPPRDPRILRIDRGRRHLIQGLHIETNFLTLPFGSAPTDQEMPIRMRRAITCPTSSWGGYSPSS